MSVEAMWNLGTIYSIHKTVLSSSEFLFMDSLHRWKPIGTMLAVNLAFAILNVLLKEIFDNGANQIIIIMYRQAISAVFLIPVAYFRERKTWSKITGRVLVYLFFSALLGATLMQYLSFLGLERTSATFSCAFVNLVPATTFLLALPFRLEKVNITNKAGAAKVCGTLICIAGAMTLTLYNGKLLLGPHSFATNQTTHANKNVSTNRREQWVVGSMLLTAGCVLWSSWFLLQAKIGLLYPCQYSSTAIMSAFSAVQSAILSLILERNFAKWVLKGKLDIISTIYAGVVGSGLCYVAMSWCVKQKGPLFTAAFTPLIQIFVAVFDFFVLHGRLYLGSVIGSILVVIGLYVLLWGRSEEAKDGEKKQPQESPGREDCNL